LKTTDELQATHHKTAKLDNAAVGVIFHHDFHTTFYESERSFVPATACLYLCITVLGMLMWRLFTSLDREAEERV